MPIVIEAVPLEKYIAWLSNQISPLLPPSEAGNNGATNPPASGNNSNKGNRITLDERKNITVSESQHEIIVGSLLGDMSAIKPGKPGPNRNTRLTISQANLPYLLSLADLLASLIRQQNPTPDNKLDRTTGIKYYGYKVLYYVSLPCLNTYRDWFYPEGVP
jgi:hypothetical protein